MHPKPGETIIDRLEENLIALLLGAIMYYVRRVGSDKLEEV